MVQSLRVVKWGGVASALPCFFCLLNVWGVVVWGSNISGLLTIITIRKALGGASPRADFLAI